MPISSRWEVPIPIVSLPTYLFTSPTHPLPQNGAFYDAANSARYLTQSDFRLYSQRLAAGLIKAGLQHGDRVLVFSGNNIFFPVLLMGIIMAGGIFTGANPGFMKRELEYQLRDCGARFLICGEDGLGVGLEAAESVGLKKDDVFIFDDEVLEGDGKGKDGVKNWCELLVSEDMGRKFQWAEKDPKEEVCCLNYSSGTTGVPKGVMITHYNCAANAVQYTHLHELHSDIIARNKRAKWLCFLPLYHAMGQAIFGTVAPKRNIPVYIMKKFDFEELLRIVERERITTLQCAPPIVVALAKSPLTKKYDLSSVYEFGSGAAPLSGDVIEEAKSLWPKDGISFSQGWGMTELTCSLLGCDPRIDAPTSSVGELNANCHAKIVDPETHKEVGVNERGELWVKAPNIMKGYWQKPEATEEVFVRADDGLWLRTGDIVYMDEQGQFYIVDRMKELIKVKGNQVAPAELEALLLEHPQIADACVVGVSSVNEGEVPRAYVVLKGEKSVSQGEIMKWVEERVIRYKRLKGGVRFIDAIPRNPSGKILRKIIRERVKEEDAKKVLKAKL